MTHFYHHLIQFDDITAELDRYEIDPAEREDLVGLIHQIFHNHTLNVILNHLPKDKHREFLDKFELTPHDLELLNYLKKEIQTDIESAIRDQAARVKKDILAEIKKSRKK